MGLPEDLLLERNAQLEEAKKFSFDVDKFQKEIDAGDMLAMVIRGHLYLEHVLIQTLTDALAVPDEIELRRLNFPAKLDLCISLGLLPREWRRSVSQINDMRNKMAHRLETNFTDADRQALFDAFPHGNAKDVCADDPSWTNLFKAIVVWFDLERQRAKAGRIHESASSKHLRRLLDETKTQREKWIAEQRAKGEEH